MYNSAHNFLKQFFRVVTYGLHNIFMYMFSVTGLEYLLYRSFSLILLYGMYILSSRCLYESGPFHIYLFSFRYLRYLHKITIFFKVRFSRLHDNIMEPRSCTIFFTKIKTFSAFLEKLFILPPLEAVKNALRQAPPIVHSPPLCYRCSRKKTMYLEK